MQLGFSIASFALVVFLSTVLAKPGGHVTEERREYYHKTSKVIDTPVQYYSTDGSGSFSSSSGALQSTWAQSHMDEVRKMADKLKSEYNYQAMGVPRSRYQSSRHGFSSGSTFDYPSFAGKSKEEMDMMARDMTEKMISDMRSGKLVYSQISQPNWFEGIAAQRLEALSQQSQSNNYENQNAEDLQQQTQEVFGAEDIVQTPQQVAGGYHKTTEKKHYEYSASHGGYQPVPTYASEVENLNQHQEQSSIVYPTTITIIGGKRYVTRKNCTSSATIGSRSPYYSNMHGQSNYDRRTQETDRNIPVVVRQGQSTYDSENTSIEKHREQSEVPVYPGSYFTDDQYDSQYSQTHDGQMPLQSKVRGQSSSDVRESSQSNSLYTIPVTGSQTVSSSSTMVQERQHQRVPVAIPTQKTVTSSMETHRQSESQQQIPITYPTGSTLSHRESSSYESLREKPIPIRPIPASSQHSIYKYMQKESEVVPNYKPEVTIDTQMMETMSQQANKYYPQRPVTAIHGESFEREEEDRQVQQSIVIPEVTFTAHHEHEKKEEERSRQVLPTRPITSTSQQTISQSAVNYRPSYPAYGSQLSREDTSEYKKTHNTSRYPQQHISGTNYETRQEYYSKEGQQPVPVFGQTSSQTVEETNHTEHQNREYGRGSTHREDQEEYTEEGQKQVPVYQGFETREEQNRTEQYTSGHRTRPAYAGGSSQVQETEDQSAETHRYIYPGQKQQTSSETEDSYWLRQHQHSRPGSIPTGEQIETENYEESSRTQYPQGVATSQTTREEETNGIDIHRRPGRPGYSVTSQFNESTSTSVSGTAEGSHTPIVVAGNQQTILEVGSEEDTQVEQRPGYGSLELETERNESSSAIRPAVTGSGYHRESSGYDYEQQLQQGTGGIRLDQTEFGSQVNRNYTSGGLNIGYVTHQLTVEEREELWRRQQEERRRQQLISTGILEESSLNQSSSYGQAENDQIQHPLGIYDGDEKSRPDTTQYGSSINLTSTSASGKPPGTIISKDRGDQPPQNYEEDYEEAEPGIGYYPSEPVAGNQVVPTTPKYEPIVPHTIDTGSVGQTTVEVWPTAAETEVQRTYHRKKSTITSTIPVILGPNGEVIQSSEMELSGQLTGGGNYQTQQTSGSLASGSLSQQKEVIGSGSLGAYESSSSSQQLAGGHGGYGTSSYGSEVQYNSNQSGGGNNRSRYATGSSSSSTSYQSGGSFSRSTAYGGQEQENEDDQGQLMIGALEDGGQQIEDLTQQSEDLTQQSEDLTQQSKDLSQHSEDLTQQSEDMTQQIQDVQQELEEMGQNEKFESQSSYSSRHQSSSGSDLRQHGERETDGHSGSSYQSHGSYSSRLSSSSGSSSSRDQLDEIPAEVHDIEAEQVLPEEVTKKPGFWSRVGQKAKDLFG